MTLVIDLPTMASNLPPPPPATLDPYIDAAARCFARFGVGRTTVPDIARELGVSRTTVYRQVGTINQLSGHLFNRELHNFLSYLPQSISDEPAPEAVVSMVESIIGYSRNHPVLSKVLVDEPELIGPFLTRELPEVVNRVGAVTIPMLTTAMGAGLLAPHDPQILVEWLVRTAVTVVLSPPTTADVKDFLRHMLLPTLSPAKGSARA